MQANWSLILNILLLMGVLVTIVLLMKARRQQNLYSPSHSKPSLAEVDRPNIDGGYNDDIIAIRKINQDSFVNTKQHQSDNLEPTLRTTTPKKNVDEEHIPQLSKKNQTPEISADIRIKSSMESSDTSTSKPASLVLFLLAKENRLFAGYELLQTVLASGLRFGEEQLFHRHQFSNGQGPVLCSLAAATDTGMFDLQNIGAFSVRGLCLFMNISKNPGIDTERFTIMLETARQLSEGLDAHLLDSDQKPLTAERIEHHMDALQTMDCIA